MEQRVAISISDGIADVRLVRADKMNALDAAMFEALVAATERLAHEKGVRVVVLSGEGRAFCAGLDMGRFAAMKESGGNGIAGGEKRDLTARTHGLANFPQQAVWGWRQLAVPVIAAIRAVVVFNARSPAVCAGVGWSARLLLRAAGKLSPHWATREMNPSAYG